MQKATRGTRQNLKPPRPREPSSSPSSYGHRQYPRPHAQRARAQAKRGRDHARGLQRRVDARGAAPASSSRPHYRRSIMIVAAVFTTVLLALLTSPEGHRRVVPLADHPCGIIRSWPQPCVRYHAGRLAAAHLTGVKDRLALFAAQFAPCHVCWLVAYPLAGQVCARPDRSDDCHLYLASERNLKLLHIVMATSRGTFGTSSKIAVSAAQGASISSTNYIQVGRIADQKKSVSDPARRKICDDRCATPAVHAAERSTST